ncbi:MAG: S1 RNA-binding domain-containing protein [Chloroflexi bacterium]|nr:S1 RNA-binding domain-containing protein [Chloroflexota bacterium]
MMQQIIENESPIYDDGWWASILADEENRMVAQPPIRHPKGEEKPKNDVDWELALEVYRQDQILTLEVCGYNRGGLLVEGGGLQGFIPCSHLVSLPARPDDDGREDCLMTYVGKSLRLKVIECVPDEGRMVFSERAAQAEAGQRTLLFNSLKPGHRVTGTVTNITDFGVFLDLGGVEGLIHISELSWGRVGHPGQVLSLGQSAEVQVIDVTPERCRVALSLKRLLPNPWETACQRYPAGMVVPAEVTALAPFGIFARIEDGLEGLVHASEIPLPPNIAFAETYQPGQQVHVRILLVDAPRQRLGLSLNLEP